jgi:endonuclease YncB( thermonuclease family)
MKKILVSLLWIMVCCLAVLPFLGEESKATGNFSVIDGDSLEHDGERIRLQDIDAPEFLQKCYDQQGWKYRCGFEAGQYLRSLVAKGIECQRLGTDRYGRSLMECFDTNGNSINRQMILAGWAVAYGEKYVKEEAQARALKKGIWSGKFMRPELYRALKRKQKSGTK